MKLKIYLGKKKKILDDHRRNIIVSADLWLQSVDGRVRAPHLNPAAFTARARIV